MKKNLLKGWLSGICLALFVLSLAACGGGSSTTVITPKATVSTATGSISTTNGTTASQISVSAPAGVTVSIPGGTTLTDASGTPVSGSVATSVSYSTTASDLPQAAAQLPAGNTLAAFVDITMGTVKHFSQPITLTINVTASGANPGDAMTVYSFDSTSGTWTFAGTYLVDANGNVSPIVTHLSIWGAFKNATPPPVQPTGLAAAVAGDGQLSLSWNAVSGATSYNLYYGTAPGVTTSSPTKVVSATNPQVVSSLIDGTPYYFVVTAVNANGESIVSSEISATPIAKPVAPSGIVASAENSQATIAWLSVPGATSYKLYYGTTNPVSTTNGNMIAVAGAAAGTSNGTAYFTQTVTQYNGAALVNGTSYYFAVVASNAAGDSVLSSQKSAKPGATGLPGSPAAVTISSTVAGQVHVVWGDYVPDATSYNVYYLGFATPPTPAPTTATVIGTGTKVSFAYPAAPSPQDIPGLTSGFTYYFSVTAVNGNGLESGGQTTPKSVVVQ